MIASGAIPAAAILLWATALVPEIVVTLGFFAAATLLQIAKPATIVSGFASSAFWLVLSGMLVGLAMTRTELGFPTIFLPYQAPPILVASDLGGIRLAEAARLTVPFALLPAALISPLAYVWWRMLGRLS